jgi:hypothetical protein
MKSFVKAYYEYDRECLAPGTKVPPGGDAGEATTGPSPGSQRIESARFIYRVQGLPSGPIFTGDLVLVYSY